MHEAMQNVEIEVV